MGLQKTRGKRDMNVNAVSWGYSRIWGLEHLLEFLGPGKDLITEGRSQASWTELITWACEVQICLGPITETHMRTLQIIPALATPAVRLLSDAAMGGVGCTPASSAALALSHLQSNMQFHS